MNEVGVTQPIYRVSVLATALLRMWRGWRILVPVVVINAIIQGLLVLPDELPYLTPAFAVLALVSFVVLALAFALVAAAMLQASVGPVSVGGVLAIARSRWWPLLAWSLALVVTVTIGLALYVVPGLIVLAITPYFLIAVIDRQPRPLAVNFRVLGARWGRWLITVAAVALICLVLWLLSALDGFFVTGFLGAIVGWLGIGLVSGWLICAWALVYRSVIPDITR